mgnify:CR=1 FL=1
MRFAQGRPTCGAAKRLVRSMVVAGALAPLGYRDFRLLWSATLVSNFGGLVQAVSAAWLMTQLTDNATLIALVQASNTLPIMLFSIPAGALADTLDRRRIMLACDVAGVALTFLGHKIDDERRAELVGHVRRTAEALTRRLHGAVPGGGGRK